jgi:cysteine desulfurase / selenocysteine lyase
MFSSSVNENYAHLFTGLEILVPTLDGSSLPYISLDNAASTPAFIRVQSTVNEFLNYYSSVHRGTGFKSQLSTHAYERAREIVLHFVGASPQTHTCLFVKNSTEALNKLARRFPFLTDRPVVITTGLEHHSNDLPWRAVTEVVHVGLTPDGYLDEPAFDAALKEYAGRLGLVTVSGASNVTGYLPPIHRLAEKAHATGAQFAVDCAQLAPHRSIDIRPLDDPAHLDYIVLSAHKMYAPFGTGALIGRKDTFERGEPDLVGGGTVEIVTLDEVVWAGPPDREEAGSPNVIGAIALAAAIRQLQEIGMDQVAWHESQLTQYALGKLAILPGIQIFGDENPENSQNRLGVIPFKLSGVSHFLTAAILGYEFAIGVRSGCFCAHPYILHLLDLTPEQSRSVRDRMLAGDKSDMPGLVRISFGLYNNEEDIDALVAALKSIIQGEYSGTYQQDRASGEYSSQSWVPDFNRYFSF